MRWRVTMLKIQGLIVFCAALVMALLSILPDQTSAQAVDFDLLIESLRAKANPGKLHRPDGLARVRGTPEEPSVRQPTQKLRPILELTEYLQCLKKRRCAVVSATSGEDEANKLGYTRLFASVYEEVKLQIRAREHFGEAMHIDDIISHFDTIVREEQQIDRIMQRRDRLTTSIAYLRALQNGDVVFPHPSRGTPRPEALVKELNAIAPSLKLAINDPLFAEMFAETQLFSDVLLRETGSISVYHIIPDLRQQIISHVGPE